MLRVLIDQDFDHDILRGLWLRLPLDAVTAFETGLSQKNDPEVLDWAARNERVILTHDRQTMPAFAYDRVVKGLTMSGLFVVSRSLPVGQAIAELELLVACSKPGEWSGMVIFVPWRL